MTTTKNTKPAIKIKDDDGEIVSYYYRRRVEREIEEEFCCEDWIDWYCNCDEW